MRGITKSKIDSIDWYWIKPMMRDQRTSVSGHDFHFLILVQNVHPQKLLNAHVAERKQKLLSLQTL